MYDNYFFTMINYKTKVILPYENDLITQNPDIHQVLHFKGSRNLLVYTTNNQGKCKNIIKYLRRKKIIYISNFLF